MADHLLATAIPCMGFIRHNDNVSVQEYLMQVVDRGGQSESRPTPRQEVTRTAEQKLVRPSKAIGHCSIMVQAHDASNAGLRTSLFEELLRIS